MRYAVRGGKFHRHIAWHPTLEKAVKAADSKEQKTNFRHTVHEVDGTKIRRSWDYSNGSYKEHKKHAGHTYDTMNVGQEIRNHKGKFESVMSFGEFIAEATYRVHDHGQGATVRHHDVEARDEKHAVDIVKKKLKASGRKYPTLTAQSHEQMKAQAERSSREHERREVSHQVSQRMRSPADQAHLDRIQKDSDERAGRYKGD
jgi:hypothetical protein